MIMGASPQYARIHSLACAIAGGAVWGVCVCLYTWWIIARGVADVAEPSLLTCIYAGYHMTLTGSVIGML